MDPFSPLELGVVLLALLVMVVCVEGGRRRRALRGAALEHLAVAARRGLALGPGLLALGRDWRGDRADALHEVAQAYQAGGSLAAALRERPDVFPERLVADVALGEQHGALPVVLDALHAEQGQAEVLRWRALNRLVYPILLCVAVLAATTFTGAAILPKLVSIADATGASPQVEPAVLAQSGLLALLVVLALGAAALARGGAAGAALLRLLAALARALPAVGAAARRIEHARWLRRVAALTGAGVALPTALEAVATAPAGTVSSAARSDLRRAAQLASEGQALPAVLGAALGPDAGALAPRVALDAAADGLPAGLARSAARLAEQGNGGLDALGEATKPVPVLVLAAVVGAWVCTVWIGFLLRLQVPFVTDLEVF